MKILSNIGSLNFLAIQLLLVNPTHAILDQNNNGVSDFYEKQYNNGNLFPVTFLASSDDDGDGWSNLREAIAGTNPFDPNPPQGIVAVDITPSQIAGNFTLSWNTIIGKSYQLQCSTNLTNWIPIGTPISTNLSTHTIGINTTQPDYSIPHKVFWRVNVTDLDSNGDGLTNAEEHIVGTNPLLPDSDFDDISDFIEIVFGSNPLLNDSDSDGVTDDDEPVIIKWFELERTLNYGFATSYELGDNYSLRVTKSWAPGAVELESFEFPLPFAMLDDELAARAAWPHIAIDSWQESQQQALGHAVIAHELIFNGGNALYTLRLNADLNHTKNVARIDRPCEHNIEILSIVQRKRIINETPQSTEYYTQEIQIPAGETESNPQQIEPYFTSGGEEMIDHDEKVVEKQFNLFFEVPKVKPNGYPDSKWYVPDELKIGKMQGGSAVDVSFVGTPQETAYLNLEQDADKFRIALEDITESAQSVLVFLETSNTDAAYSDAGQWISLTKDGKRWVSKSQLLVSNQFDDQYTQGGDHSIGADESATDRTHLAALDSVVKVSKILIDEDEIITNRSSQVKTKGTITLDIVNMKQGEIFAVTNAQITNDIKITKECYAQVGVKVVAEETEIKNVPSGIDILDAEGILLEEPVRDHYDGNTLWEYNILTEFQAIINAINKPYDNKIVVAYVVRFTEENDDIGGILGHAIQRANYRDQSEAQYTHMCFVGRLPELPLGIYTAAHEISHISGNLMHDSGGGGDLMATQSYLSRGNKISDRKRFAVSQEQKIRQERFFLPIQTP